MGFLCLYIILGVMTISGACHLVKGDYSRATNFESWANALIWPVFVLFVLIALISMGFVLIYEVCKEVINGIKKK